MLHEILFSHYSIRAKQMKFCIPHPSDRLDLKLLEKYDNVSEVYLKGPSPKIGTGRIQDYRPSESYFRNLCKEIHDRGCEVNVLLNATCYGGEEYTKKWIENVLEYLELLESMKVDVVTVTYPYLLSLIRHYSFPFKVVVSVLSYVLTPVRAQYFDGMGADRITLAPDVNRDLETVREIRKAVRCKLGAIVNEGCLLDCPYRPFCYNYISHVSVRRELRRISSDKGILGEHHWFDESQLIIRNPYRLLTSPWIRPENLVDYERLGVEYFKISGRELPCIFLEKCLEAYHSGRFEGNIFEIIDGALRLPDAWSKKPTGFTHYGPTLYYLNNKDLNDFFRKVSTCSKNCPECGFCGKFAEENLKENEEVSESYRRLFKSTRYVWMPWNRSRP